MIGSGSMQGVADSYLFHTSNSSPIAGQTNVHPTRSSLPQQLKNLLGHTKEAEEDGQRIEQNQQNYAVMYFDLIHGNAMSSEQKTIAEQTIHQKATVIIRERLSLVEKFKVTVEEISLIQFYLLDTELIEWHREQQLAGNGKLLDGELLNSIQEWFNELAEIIWLTLQQMIRLEHLRTQVSLEDMGINNMIEGLKTHLTNLLTTLVNSSLVIENQPTQVLKTDRNFSCTVRLLVGHALNVHMTPPTVSVAIITDTTVSALLQNQCRNINAHCVKVVNDTRTIMYNKKTKQMSVNFTNMKLGDVKALRKNMEKKGPEGVSDQKFALYFQTSFAIGGGELIYTVWTISLPVVVTVHTSQDADAWATVLWDNAFSERGRTSFSVAESVPWCKFAEMLNMWITAETGKGLTDQHVNYLAGKVFRNSDILPSNDSLLTRLQFCKDYLPNRHFTFWRWFYEITKIIAVYMKSQWKDKNKLIEGFIGRGQTEELLKNSQSGTFILRFSDSQLGGITIACVSEKKVYFIKPFCKTDLSIMSLHKRIHDIKDLIYLYPSNPKENAFGKCSDTSDEGHSTSNGYVTTDIKVTVGLKPEPKTGTFGTDSMEVSLISGRPSNMVLNLPGVENTNYYNIDFSNIIDYDDISIEDIQLNELIHLPSHGPLTSI